MSNNSNIDTIEKSNDSWINWIEEALAKEYLKYYEFENFKNIQEIGSGAFGKVFRANWKNIEHYLALKSFFNLNNVTFKEIIDELILQRDVDLLFVFTELQNLSQKINLAKQKIICW
ncbi:hypothetical protein RclHR1_05750006 [Rhizophagus clarus]|uniref:Protein kinase domain-containing protein n=1 Tax=Rhizophagus clarus TaxID=94130 RepID=A0A2Z6RPR9_9GLOM|nr:hypothetical protein RclHR1_05750006 [Rhizophagus clarus]